MCISIKPLSIEVNDFFFGPSLSLNGKEVFARLVVCGRVGVATPFEVGFVVDKAGVGGDAKN